MYTAVFLLCVIKRHAKLPSLTQFHMWLLKKKENYWSFPSE